MIHISPPPPPVATIVRPIVHRPGDDRFGIFEYQCRIGRPVVRRPGASAYTCTYVLVGTTNSIRVGA